jgi:hypothetical protein
MGMSEWHTIWQSYFKGTCEKKYKHKKMIAKCRKADVDLNNTHIIEFQHSYIKKKELN